MLPLTPQDVLGSPHGGRVSDPERRREWAWIELAQRYTALFGPDEAVRRLNALATGVDPDLYLGRIDCDNAAKSALDACNGVCFGDDVQIVRLFVTKVASERPGLDLRIEALEPQVAP